MRNSVAVKVKSNASYICQECGSTELIQAHHEIPGNDNSLIALCSACHSRRHPDVPRSLFFNQTNQPYWNNKSASSIARELGVHPRTIIRAARKLQIPVGHLSPFDEELIKNNVPKMQWGRPKPNKIGQRQLVRERRAPITEFTLITDAFLSVPETANEFRETESTINRWIEANKLIAITFGGILFVPKSEIERLKNKKAKE